MSSDADKHVNATTGTRLDRAASGFHPAGQGRGRRTTTGRPCLDGLPLVRHAQSTMVRSARNRLRLLAAGVLLSALLVGSTTASGANRDPGDSSRPPVHSSDGVRGPLASPVPDWLRGATSTTEVESYRVAPGLRYRHWVQTDVRGPVHAHLLRANLDKPRLSLEYVGPAHVSERAALSSLLDADEAVAGVNADFFDISDTGAPLGVGVDDGRVLHGPRSGWITGFSLTGRSDARIGAVPVRAVVVRGPRIRITDVNSPHLGIDGIGMYTARWGTAPGHAVTDGAPRRNVRQVHIRRGRVVSNTRSVSTGVPIRGRLLIGRGAGARQLAERLPVGRRIKIAVSAAGAPRVAIGGSEVLVARGEVLTTDDGELHPRTAVGIDSDTGRVLLLVVDGRSDASRGYTLLELARLMVELGAEGVLNLDGGGSSTMGVTPPGGALTVANSPSDGQERPVPNGLGLVRSG